MLPANPFHEGELAVQRRAGETEPARRNGQIITDRIPAGALPFIERQGLAVLATVDPEDGLWASLLLGVPGFAQAPDLGRLQLDLRAAASHPDDPLWRNLEHDPRLGLLLIELATRRRLRINGKASITPERVLEIAVEEAYPNCPKYIQRRHPKPASKLADFVPAPARRGQSPLAEHRLWIERADTFFIASAHPERAADASHRGGNPGFVRWVGESTLEVPDYPGNSMFNTLGNLALNPRAGLLFPDFEQHRVLQLSGRVRLCWPGEAAPATTGHDRRWSFEIERWVESELPPLYAWELLDASPYNP